MQYRRSALPILVAVCSIGCGSADEGTAPDDPSPNAPMAPSAPNAAGAPNGSGNAATPPATRPSGAGNESPDVAPVSSSQGSQGVPNSAAGRGGAAGQSDDPPGSDDEDDEDSPNAGTGGAGNAPGSGGSPANGGGSATPPDDPPVADDVPSFAADVLPILRAECGSCHGAGFLPRFAATNADAAYTVAADLSANIVRRIEQGTMPPACGRGAPGDSGCVSEDDFDTIQAWAEGGAPE